LAVQLSSLPFLPSGLLFLQSNGAEGALRCTIINNLEQDSETASELQRTGRITIVLVGTGSPLAAVYPAWRLSRMQTAEALRGE
jgi:ABC-type lipoprotein release transport system permease subunit